MGKAHNSFVKVIWDSVPYPASLSMVRTLLRKAAYGSRIYLCGSLVRTLLRKVATPPHHIQNFASQSGLRPPHHGHDFRKRKLPLATAPSCAVSRSKHFATQNGLLSKFCYAKPPTASAVFAVFDRPVFFGVHTLRFIARSKFSELYLILKLYEFELNNNLKNIRKAHVITHELFLYFKLWLCLCF